MKNGIIAPTRNRNAICFGLIILGLSATVPLSAADEEHAHHHSDRAQNVPAKLVQAVRDATRQFVDVNVATNSGYGQFLGCISGPDHGAMGIHYVNGSLVGDGELDATKPEALIYEPTDTGLKLVGVEFIVDAATWLKKHDAPPVLEGQSFQYVGSPNRYNLPPFFELHVWAWRNNPHGAFVDWNTRVSCEGPQ